MPLDRTLGLVDLVEHSMPPSLPRLVVLIVALLASEVEIFWANRQAALLEGQLADAIDLIFRTPQREPYYDFTAPYADTADYAKATPAVDSARVAGNSHLLQGKDTTALWNAKSLQGKDTAALWNAKTLQGKDTTALWNAKALQGKDTTGFVRTGQADAVTSAMMVNGTIVRADVAGNFKAPYADTADYAIAAPASDSARVAGNSHLLQTKDTTALWNAKTLQGKDTTALWNAKTLQGKDTAALWNAKTLQGKDTTGFVRTGQADAVTSAMIVPNTIVRADVASNFKAPYSDTADYAISAPAPDSSQVAGNQRPSSLRTCTSTRRIGTGSAGS